LKTIQVSLDERLLIEMDRVISVSGITRSAFIRDALRRALWRHRIAQMERKHAEGYARRPVRPGEFDEWEDEQVWPKVQKPGFSSLS
jgi:hypothetical protein